MKNGPRISLRSSSVANRSRRGSAVRSVALQLIALIPFVCFVLPSAARAQQNVWQAPPLVLDAWSNAAKWSLNTVPDGSTDILLPTGSAVVGDYSFQNNHILKIDPSAALFVLSTTTITNLSSSGQILNGGSLNNGGTVNGAGSLGILNYGSIVNRSGAQIIDGLGFNNKASSILSNAGTLEFAELENGGSITNSAGALLVASTLNNNFGTLNNSGALTSSQFSNFSTVNNAAGTLDVGGFLSYGLVTNSAGAQMTINGNAINKDGATLSNDGTLNNLGSFVNGGQLLNTTNGILNNKSSLTNTQTLMNSGTMNNSGSLENLGLFQIGNGGIVNNTGGIGNTQGGVFTVLNGGILNNSGTLINDFTSALTTAAGSSVVNTGNMSLGGTVGIGGNLRNNGTITMLAGPITGDPPTQTPAPALLITSTGKLSGTGTVNQGLFGFGVINQGIMAPGDPGGIFTIQGNYQQTSTGMLEIFLGGIGAGEFGQLDITGGADLSGTLDVELFAGFDPQSGEIFEILESGGITNLDFMSMLFPTLPDGLFFKLDKEGNNLFLDVMGGTGGGGGTSVPEPGTDVLLFGALAVMFVCSRFPRRPLRSRV